MTDKEKDNITNVSNNNHPTANENGALSLDQVKLEENAAQSQTRKSKRESINSSNSKVVDSRRPSQKPKESKANFDVFQVQNEQEETNPWPKLAKFLDSNFFNIVITLITVYALFGDDIRVLAFQKDDDIYFDVVTIIALLSFSIEISLSVCAKPGYQCSFFFWLDILSTLSLILDIQFVSNALFFNSSAASTANLARAGRASRVGTKAGRVVRLVRLIRIVKLYKASTDLKAQKKSMEQKLRAKRSKKAQNKGLKKMTKEQELAEERKWKQQQKEEEEKEAEQRRNEPQKESRVSKKLSDLTTKRVIVIVLSLLFVMPVFNSDYHFSLPDTVPFQGSILKDFSEDNSTSILDIGYTINYLKSYGLEELSTEAVEFTTFFSEFEDDMTGIVETEFKPLIKRVYDKDKVQNLRKSELNQAIIQIDETKFCQFKPVIEKDNSDYLAFVQKICEKIKGIKINDDDPNDLISFTIKLNTRDVEIFRAWLSLGRTLFVCIVLTMGALLFSKDANDLALRPIERMIEKVNQIARNPNDAKNQDVIEGKDQYETVIIENAITKIGTLLALGFGDAGSEIIGQNMQSVGELNPISEGKKKLCIYGFCDIRNFTDATEQLQEEVMLFVNNIGGVVHNMVDRFLGAANKNIGDAFLLVWKIPDDKAEIQQDNSIEYLDQEYISVISDLATVSFMKIQAKINREPFLLAYRENEKLLERFPDYKVRIGYGLHIGWSIEGAIGSEYKIDASYLSPNVKMSERLEGTTKAYGVPLLISQDLYEKFTPQMKQFVRKVDRVLFQGSKNALCLYTIDMFVDDIPQSKGPVKEKVEKQIEDRLKRDEIKELLENNEWDAKQYITNNKDLKLILKGRKEDFYPIYNIAIESYIQGDWVNARNHFQQGQEIWDGDNVTKTILNFMAQTNYNCPSDWQNYRNMAD